MMETLYPKLNLEEVEAYGQRHGGPPRTRYDGVEQCGWAGCGEPWPCMPLRLAVEWLSLVELAADMAADELEAGAVRNRIRDLHDSLRYFRDGANARDGGE